MRLRCDTWLDNLERVLAEKHLPGQTLHGASHQGACANPGSKSHVPDANRDSKKSLQRGKRTLANKPATVDGQLNYARDRTRKSKGFPTLVLTIN